jgi:hypothetical protein
MERCKTCKHWQPGTIGEGRAKIQPAAGRCDRIEATDSSELKWDEDDEFHDREATLLNGGIPLVGNDAVTMDGSGYFSAIVTGAEFGCTLHKPADPSLSPRPA